MNKKEQTRLRVERYRDKQKSVTSDSVTSPSVTLLKRPNRMGANGMIEMVENEYNPAELMPDGSKRYIGPFTDGMVSDRTTLPLPNRELPVPRFTPVKTRLS